MLRRTGLRRNVDGWGSRTHYERNARENLKRRERIYHKDGSLNIPGVFSYFWDHSNKTITFGVSFVVLMYLYNKVVAWANRRYTKDMGVSLDNRNQYLRASGKLKSEKYMIQPLRQIEDPDIDNPPCYTISEDEDRPIFSRVFLDEDDWTSNGGGDPRFHK